MGDDSEQETDGSKHWDGPGLDAWDAWTPAEVAERLAAVDIPWCVVGGWAIDLYVGQPTREHEDLEIGILREDFAAVRRRFDADRFWFHAVDDGEVRRLPVGEETPPEKHQNWVLDVDAQAWRVDVMLEPGDATTWRCRRHDDIAVARSTMIGRTADGIPYLRPTGALLYKAKAVRPKDEADFATCLPLLSDAERAWLADAIEVAHHGHRWVERVRAAG
jgi:hypothetical protein